MSDDENSSDTVPKIVSAEPTKVRSILKGSSPKKEPIENTPKKNLRAAIAARDEKRIQFDIKEEDKKALVMDIPDEVKKNWEIQNSKFNSSICLGRTPTIFTLTALFSQIMIDYYFFRLKVRPLWP